MAWKTAAGLKGTDKKQELGERMRTKDKNSGFTSNHALWSVGDVVQGNVSPHVSAHFCLEGHPKGCRVGQDETGIRPLVTMVSCCCPHQQTRPTGSNSVDLVRYKEHGQFDVYPTQHLDLWN